MKKYQIINSKILADFIQKAEQDTTEIANGADVKSVAEMEDKYGKDVKRFLDSIGDYNITATEVEFIKNNPNFAWGFLNESEEDESFKDYARRLLSENVNSIEDKNQLNFNFSDTEQSLETTNPANFINHSGGAYGGDTFWDQIGREFGVTNHKHYKDAGNPNLSQQLKNTQKIYSKLGNKTQSENVIIKSWGELK